MNQEKKVLQTDRSAVEYLAPKVMVWEIKAMRVICTSGQLTDIEKEDGEW